MAEETQPISFEDFTQQIRSIFEQVKQHNEAVLVERNGQLFRLERAEQPDDIWSAHDPARVRQALNQSAGALAGVDREQLLADIHAQHGQDSAGRPA